MGVDLLVTGASGMLGSAVVEEARRRGVGVEAFSRARLDVTDPDSVRVAVHDADPGAVVHCAGYTDVERAEEEEELAFLVNAEGAGHVARACRDAGGLMLYPSTDYVFDGTATSPYHPDDPARPLNVYGRSKLAGEEAVRDSGGDWLVVRTSWLFGGGGKNFVDTILGLAGERERVEVVDDQRSRPTWTGCVAGILLDLLDAGARGVLHAANRGEATWCELARKAVDLAGLDAVVEPVSTGHFAAAARRPAYSVLALDATEDLLGRALPHWRESLRAYLEGG